MTDPNPPAWRPDRHNLPEVWTDVHGTLDVDTLRKLAPLVRAGLIDAVREAATLARAARGSVVTPEDTYGLVRSLTGGGEVLRQWAAAFEAAAKECDALTEEEALTAMGEQDGVPNGSLFVPDGVGQRIAVRADWKAGAQTWDVDSLCGWVAEEEVDDAWATLPANHQEDEVRDAMMHAATGALERLRTLAEVKPRVRAVEEQRKRLAALQRDADAAVLGQLRTVGDRVYQGVKITREEVKP